MKPRARRVTLAAAILGAGVVGVIVAVQLLGRGSRGGIPMGDNFEVIVDVEVSVQDAKALADKVTQALLDQGIILPYQKRDLVNPFTGEAFVVPGHQHFGGFPAGPNASETVEERPDSGFGFPSGDRMFDRVEVITGRQFHGESEEAPVSVSCPHCKRQGSDPYTWLSAAEQWEKTGRGLVSCNYCREETSVLEWKTDPLWVFGNLGFQFWNWPKLHKDFVGRVSELLGHRIVVVQGMF